MRHVLLFFASWALITGCGGSSPLPATQAIDASTTLPNTDAGFDGGQPSPSPDTTVSASCRSDDQCGAASMCLGERCIGRCAAPPPTNLVPNAGFDREVWVGADKDRGAGPRLPRWDASDSVGCSSSGSLAVSDRTSFSPPMEIGPPGTKYYWGFRAKLSRLTPGPRCEIHWCTDISCLFFITGEEMGPGRVQGGPGVIDGWQSFYSITAMVPTPNPPSTPLPYAQIACFGYDEVNGPEALFDRFYFSREAVPF